VQVCEEVVPKKSVRLSAYFMLVTCLAYFSTLIVDAVCSSETSQQFSHYSHLMVCEE
jgi:hypothetical protein